MARTKVRHSSLALSGAPLAARTASSSLTSRPLPRAANRPQVDRWQGPAQAARCQGCPQVGPGRRWCQEASPLPPGNGRPPRDSSLPEVDRAPHPQAPVRLSRSRYRRRRREPLTDAAPRPPAASSASFARSPRTSRPTCASSRRPSWRSRRPPRPTSSRSSRTPTLPPSTPSVSRSSPRVRPLTRSLCLSRARLTLSLALAQTSSSLVVSVASVSRWLGPLVGWPSASPPLPPSSFACCSLRQQFLLSFCRCNSTRAFYHFSLSVLDSSRARERASAARACSASAAPRPGSPSALVSG